jgi:type I restriction enzyme S subunit
MSEALPEGWVWVSLDEVGQLFCGQSPPTKDVNTVGKGTLYVTGPEQWDGKDIHANKWTTDPRRLVPDHCLFITVKGAGVGTLFPGVACAIGRDIYAYRPSLHLSGSFLRFALQHTIDEIIRQAAGLIPGLTREHLLGHSIPLAPLAEQQRIVGEVEALLARVNAARQRLARVPAILKRFRQSVLAAACSGRLTADCQDADEDQDELPLGWEERRIKDMLREPLRNGHSARASTDGTGVRTLTLSAVTYADFTESNTKLTTADPDRVSALWLEPGDILIERSNTPELVGTAAMYRGARGWAIFPDLLIRVRIDERFSHDYVELFLRSERAHNYFRESAQGTAGSMPKIDQSVIEELVVPLPPPAEQHEIVRRVEAVFRLADAIEKRVASATARAEKLTQAILSRAFRGELVPTEAELARREGRPYEPASALLERIRADGTISNRARRAPARPRRRRGRIAPTVTFIYGLCGAGKSYLAREMESKGIQRLDEGFPDPPAGKNLSPQKYAKLQEYLRAGRDCAVVEATLFVESVRQEAEAYVRDIPNVKIEWVAFEADLAIAKHNCLHRQEKGDGPGHAQLNERWMRDYSYTFPDGVKPRQIYKRPCEAGPACPVCNSPK